MERIVQTFPTPFNIFEIKRIVESMLRESSNQFQLIQHAFNKLSTLFAISAMLNDLFKRLRHLAQQSVEANLK